MQFLSVSRRKPGVSDEAAAALGGDEAQRVRELYSQGLVRQIWHRADIPGACMVWEAANEQQVRDMLDTLPYAQAEMLEIQIFPLVPYGGFGPKKKP
jgi:muconolactone delta-isomerase